MTVETIRQKLSDYFQIADNKKIKAIYTLLENDIDQTERKSIEQYSKGTVEAMVKRKRGAVLSHEEVANISKSR